MDREHEDREHEDRLESVEALLRGVREIELTGEGSRALWRRAFRPEYGDLPPLEELHQYRIVVGWRLCRHLALQMRWIGEDEGLQQALDSLGNTVWHEKERPLGVSATSTGAEMASAASLRELMSADGGLPLLPPDVPERFTGGATHRGRYRPGNREHDPDLHRWLEVMGRLASSLKMGSHDRGVMGMAGMFAPSQTRELWPNSEELLLFEEAIIEDTLVMVVSGGEHEAQGYLRREFGIMPRESSGLIAMVQREACSRVSSDVDVQRALISMRIQALMNTARGVNDVKTVRWLLKDLATVLGVTRAEAESWEDEAAGIAGRLGVVKPAERPIRQLGTGTGGHATELLGPMEG